MPAAIGTLQPNILAKFRLKIRIKIKTIQPTMPAAFGTLNLTILAHFGLKFRDKLKAIQLG